MKLLPTLALATLALPLALLAAGLVSGRAGAAQTQLHNDFPTAARADYVFACMAANGQTQEMLQRCSCSLDVVASIMPYDDYVEAETVLRMRQLGGENTAIFRDTKIAKDYVDQLRGAQAEAELRCF
ncbi:hypothetical protein SAMN06265365_10920 [Tistlia consotensis]|uniref:Secreted protein n=1 Tax=Tistlia consotensis USBA 355 TaxID=560819 RepID=A0A1Y6CVI5_9PROT|nr:hypothetical protein [Tistlia consotensis]SMF80290.1 hypothetical protein SAMN05428998_14120 [Tistlia consotensis USBA 355]SNR62434.1 hypothetical protein SAMN06265365_10920 [Tistlia consotensis]